MFDLIDAGLEFAGFFWTILKIWRFIFIKSYRIHILNVWKENEPMQRSNVIFGALFSIIFNLLVIGSVFWLILF